MSDRAAKRETQQTEKSVEGGVPEKKPLFVAGTSSQKKKMDGGGDKGRDKIGGWGDFNKNP